MILSNEKFDLTAPRLVFRWAASRLGIYFGAAIAGLILFYAGAAFYSFVWPAPPVAVPVTPTFQPATDPVRGIEKFFDPKNAEPVLVSQLSLDQIKKATLIVGDGHDFGHPTPSLRGRELFVNIVLSSTGMSNDFGMRTPSLISLRADDLGWYRVQSSTHVALFAVATQDQINRAIEKEIERR